MPQTRYAIIGAGALGGYYGSCLQRGGLDVHFLLRSDYDHVREHGLTIESKNGDFNLPHVHAYSRATDMPPCDVIIVALKTTQNHLLPAILPPMLKPDSIVLLLQNGLGLEEPIAAIVGPDRVLGGAAFLCSNKVGPGHIRHLDYNQIALAQYDPHDRPRPLGQRAKQIAADFRQAGITIDEVDDLGLMRWQKLVWNIPYNGLSVVLNARTDQLMADPASRSLVEALMLEVIAGASACGHAIPTSFAADRMAHTDRMVPYAPSMQLDYQRHRPMEIESIFAQPVRRAHSHGVELHRIDTLCKQLQFLDTNKAPGTEHPHH